MNAFVRNQRFIAFLAEPQAIRIIPSAICTSHMSVFLGQPSLPSCATPPCSNQQKKDVGVIFMLIPHPGLRCPSRKISNESPTSMMKGVTPCDKESPAIAKDRNDSVAVSSSRFKFAKFGCRRKTSRNVFNILKSVCYTNTDTFVATTWINSEMYYALKLLQIYKLNLFIKRLRYKKLQNKYCHSMKSRMSFHTISRSVSSSTAWRMPGYRRQLTLP